MTLEQLFEQINSVFRGSDDDVPTVGSEDYTNWLLTANRKLSEYARDTNVSRQSLWEDRTLGSITFGTNTYDLDENFLTASDRVYVLKGTQYIYYTLQKPQERERLSNTVYISGFDPQTLTFQTPFTATEQAVGGVLHVPGYYLPDELENANDVVPCDNPMWMVYATAAELASNDLQYSDKAPDLNSRANDLWDKMVRLQRRGTSDNPRTLQYNVDAVRNTSVYGWRRDS